MLDGQSIQKTFDKLIINYTRRGKKPNNEIAQILKECAAHFEEGTPLAEALKAWFPEQEISVIEACHIAGRPADGFQKAIHIAHATEQLKKAIRGALLTSAYLFSLSLTILTLAYVMLVPLLLESVPLVQWSLAQKGVYYFYLFVISWGGGVALHRICADLHSHCVFFSALGREKAVLCGQISPVFLL